MRAPSLYAVTFLASIASLAAGRADAGEAAGSGIQLRTPIAPAAAARPNFAVRNLAGLWLISETPVFRRETLRPEFATRFTTPNTTGPAAGTGLADVARGCVPSPLFGAANGYPLRIIQTPTQLTLLSEENGRIHRIYLDRDFPERLVPSYEGFSVGHWEGNTLVAETRGLKSPAGTAVLPDYRVIERLRRGADGMTLEHEISIESAAFQTPAQRSFRYFLRPDLRWQPAVCEEAPAPALRAAR